MSEPRVLLLSPNREASPDLVPPLALAFLAGALREAGIESAVLDMMVEEDPDAALVAALRSFDPDVVALSVRNIDNTSYPAARSFVPELRAVAGTLREHGRPVVVGGSGASIAPEALLDRLGLDVAVVGEGEGVLAELVRALSRGEPAPDLPGVVRRTTEGFVRRPPEPMDLSRCPAPDYGALDLASYRRLGGVVGVQTKRGCPLTCAYCVYPGIEGRRYRLRPPAEVVEEVRRLHDDFGIDRFFFVDSVFNQPEAFALQVVRGVGALGRSLAYGAYLSPGRISSELAEALVASGCEGVELGTDSLAPAVLDALDKHYGADDVTATARTLSAAGLPQCHHIIFGAPGETRETVEETIGRLDEIDPEAVIGMTGVRVYPGTPLARRMFGDEEPDLLMPWHHVAPAVEGFLEERLTEHARSRRGWILPGLGLNFDDELFRRIRESGFRGPAWILAKRLG